MECVRLQTKNTNADVMIGGTRKFLVTFFFPNSPLTEKTLRKTPHRTTWQKGAQTQKTPQSGTETTKSDPTSTSAFVENPPKRQLTENEHNHENNTAGGTIRTRKQPSNK